MTYLSKAQKVAASSILLLSLGACASQRPKQAQRPVASVAESQAMATEPVRKEGSSELRKNNKFITLSQNIHFNAGSSEITPSSRRALNELALEIKGSANTFDKIVIEGLTDNQGEVGRTQRLADARARNVRNYLIRRGVSPVKLEAVGKGSVNREIAGTTSQQARDRRVDFTIVE